MGVWDIILWGGRLGGAGAVWAPARGPAAAAAAGPKKEGKEGFEDFPEALDAEDDDLPF